MTTPLPLQGVKVLELGQLIAGPFAAKTLGDFGADVIKVEPPGGGDPLRQWRLLRNGTSVWWEVQSRNKRSVCLDLRTPEGQAAVRQLATEADVLIENFKPGTLEQWGLGWDALHALNPKLVMLRLSGYGQTGPYAHKPGFGILGEAMGGLRHLTGEPGRVPVRTGVSIGDSIAALHGVIGVLMALYHRTAHGGQGQVVDVALYESVFNLMESLLPEYDAFGTVRERAGSALPGIAPSNAYRCADGGYVLIGGNGDSIFKRLMHAIGRADLADDPDLARNDGRARRASELDQAIEAWTLQHTVDDTVRHLDAASVPAGRIYTAADIAHDPQYLAREMVLQTTARDGQPLKVPGIVPKLGATPGRLQHPAPQLGEHTQDVLQAQAWPARAPETPPMTDTATEDRLVNLEIKTGLSDDWLERLNEQVYRQQLQIERLQQEVARLTHRLEDQPGTFHSLRDELPPHY
ncbi:SlyX family protein [Macromonas nakdongensis]|uniref:SlyX family protein n=1 Tax=Macromonas nakdongensis TaxID=1843082 RepID=UPI000C321AD4|nr:SlyX family protein [Macromonas nakdongensis]